MGSSKTGRRGAPPRSAAPACPIITLAASATNTHRFVSIATSQKLLSPVPKAAAGRAPVNGVRRGRPRRGVSQPPPRDCASGTHSRFIECQCPGGHAELTRCADPDKAFASAKSGEQSALTSSPPVDLGHEGLNGHHQRRQWGQERGRYGVLAGLLPGCEHVETYGKKFEHGTMWRPAVRSLQRAWKPVRNGAMCSPALKLNGCSRCALPTMSSTSSPISALVATRSPWCSTPMGCSL